ncbi:hypothetical protein Hanom_Chr07g00603841 [Helianthus anomalus]
MPRPIRWAGNDHLPNHGLDQRLCQSRSGSMVLVHQPNMGLCLLRNQEYRDTSL